METKNPKLKNELNNLSGEYEALGLDLYDIVQMASNFKLIEKDINALKKSLDQAIKARDNMLNKLGIGSEEK